jgi:hypothetical protein
MLEICSGDLMEINHLSEDVSQCECVIDKLMMA